MKTNETYLYTDEIGTPLYQVERSYDGDKKKFVQMKWDKQKEQFVSGYGCMEGVRRVPYMLEKIKDKKKIFLVEGEKDVHTCWNLNLPATTTPAGSNSWKASYAEILRSIGVEGVCIVPDADKQGYKYMAKASKDLMDVGITVKCVTLPGVEFSSGKDISDWISNGGSKEQLIEEMKRTSPLDQDGLNELEYKFSSSFNVMSVSELRKQADEEMVNEWVVDQQLASGCFSMLVGREGSGKSTLARCIAASVVKGRSILDYKTNQGSVLYCAFEESKRNVRIHLDAMQLEDTDQFYTFVGSPPENGLQELRDFADHIKPKLIVLDTISDVANIKDSNNYAEVKDKLSPIVDIARKTNAHILALHHASKYGNTKGTDSSLGSVAYAAIADLVYVFKVDDDGNRTIETAKTRGLGQVDTLVPTLVELDMETGMVTKGSTLIDKNVKDKADDILEHIKISGSVEQKDLRNLVGGSGSLISRSIKHLCDEHKIDRTRKDRSYILTLPKNRLERDLF